MDFRYRKLLLFLTLPPLFFALAQARHESRQFRMPNNGLQEIQPEAIVPPPSEVGIQAAADIEALPFVAVDNTCRYCLTQLNLSGCTGWVSGESAVLYRIVLKRTNPLFVSLRPQRQDLDVSLSLFRMNEEGQLVCVEGEDGKAEGRAERLRVESLDPGTYYIAVGGYGADCGEFELSVESQAPMPVSLKGLSVSSGDGGALIRWETISEADLSYFRLYRRDVGENARKPVFQPRSRGDFSRGAQYQFLDRNAAGKPCAYVLTAVDHDGREVELEQRLD
jgi:hypothetical protein